MQEISLSPDGGLPFARQPAPCHHLFKQPPGSSDSIGPRIRRCLRIVLGGTSPASAELADPTLVRTPQRPRNVSLDIGGRSKTFRKGTRPCSPWRRRCTTSQLKSRPSVLGEPGPLRPLGNALQFSGHPAEGRRLLRPLVAVVETACNRAKPSLAVGWKRYSRRPRAAQIPLGASMSPLPTPSPLVEPRPYREPLSPHASLERTARPFGNQFDRSAPGPASRLTSPPAQRLPAEPPVPLPRTAGSMNQNECPRGARVWEFGRPNRCRSGWSDETLARSGGGGGGGGGEASGGGGGGGVGGRRLRRRVGARRGVLMGRCGGG